MVTVLTDTDTPAPTLTDTTGTTARGPLMPSPDMVTTAEDTDTVDTGTESDTEDTTMARGPLMPSPDMVTTAADTGTDTVTVTDTATGDEAAQEVHVYQSD